MKGSFSSMVALLLVALIAAMALAVNSNSFFLREKTSFQEFAELKNSWTIARTLVDSAAERALYEAAELDKIPANIDPDIVLCPSGTVYSDKFKEYAQDALSKLSNNSAYCTIPGLSGVVAEDGTEFGFDLYCVSDARNQSLKKRVAIHKEVEKINLADFMWGQPDISFCGVKDVAGFRGIRTQDCGDSYCEPGVENDPCNELFCPGDCDMLGEEKIVQCVGAESASTPNKCSATEAMKCDGQYVCSYWGEPEDCFCGDWRCDKYEDDAPLDCVVDCVNPVGITLLGYHEGLECAIGYVELNWEQPTLASPLGAAIEPPGLITEYKIYRGTSPSSIVYLASVVSAEPGVTPPPTTYNDSDSLSLDQTYYYEISAVVNGIETRRSQKSIFLPLPPLPPAPEITSMTFDDVDNEITVEWTIEEPPCPTHFNLARSHDFPTGDSSIDLAYETRNYVDGDIEQCKEYCYTVSAVDLYGQTNSSDAGMDCFTDLIGEPPPAPTISKSRYSAAYDRIELSWSSSGDYYVVERSPAWETVSEKTVSSAFFNDTEVEIGADYSYKLFAVDSCGDIKSATAAQTSVSISDTEFVLWCGEKINPVQWCTARGHSGNFDAGWGTNRAKCNDCHTGQYYDVEDRELHAVHGSIMCGEGVSVCTEIGGEPCGTCNEYKTCHVTGETYFNTTFRCT